jgi:glutathionylspermidine synthase
MKIEDVGIDNDGRFTDSEDRLIHNIFKLYPWEWLLTEEFAQHIPESGTTFIEPAWKSILSNKGLLALLWEMFEGHPNLLPTYFADDPKAEALGDTYVRKPIYSREGQNIEIVHGDTIEMPHPGDYGAEGHVAQAYHPLPEFEGNYPMAGCWLIASAAAGMCIREDRTLVTGDDARFIPHVILD